MMSSFPLQRSLQSRLGYRGALRNRKLA